MQTCSEAQIDANADALYIDTFAVGTFAEEPVLRCFTLCGGAGAKALEHRAHSQSGTGAAARGLHLQAAAPTCLSQDPGELHYLHGDG